MQIEPQKEATGGIMTPEHQDQMQRLAKFRESARIARERAPTATLTTSPTAGTDGTRTAQAAGEDGDNKNIINSEYTLQLLDPLIYPGLYSPSGFNIMSILLRVRYRPNPIIDIGMIDDSCALLLCDLSLPDMPIVYASEPFTSLTHYTPNEVIGKNCRFLQSPSGRVEKGSRREYSNDASVREVKDKLASREEVQVTVTNYKKGGERFENILTVVPIRWQDGGDIKFLVGFQVDRQKCFVGPSPPPPLLVVK